MSVSPRFLKGHTLFHKGHGVLKKALLNHFGGGRVVLIDSIASCGGAMLAANMMFAGKVPEKCSAYLCQ